MITVPLSQIERLTYALEAHGYIVVSEPIPGMDAEFEDGLRKSLKAIEDVMSINSKSYNVVGRSKRALAMLHADLPNPGFGVELP